jgi:hypothetical protein
MPGALDVAGVAPVPATMGPPPGGGAIPGVGPAGTGPEPGAAAEGSPGAAGGSPPDSVDPTAPIQLAAAAATAMAATCA